MATVVKRRGHEEPFDSRKVYGSVYAACRAAHCNEPSAEETAAKVSDAVTEWVEARPRVTSDEIFNETADILKVQHAGAALLFHTHRDVA